MSLGEAIFKLLGRVYRHRRTGTGASNPGVTISSKSGSSRSGGLLTTLAESASAKDSQVQEPQKEDTAAL
jgi:hypothetical protein